MLTSGKNCEGNLHICLDFLKLHDKLSICAKFQVFHILMPEVKKGGSFTPSPFLQRANTGSKYHGGNRVNP